MPTSPSEAVESGPVAGLAASASLEVTEAESAVALGTGDVPGLATPRLVALCEEACWLAVRDHLGPGRTCVGSRVRFDHLVPVPVGATVTAEAILERVEGRRLVFTVTVALHCDGRTGLVGAGRLTRVLVDRGVFLAKLTPAGGAGCGPGSAPER